MGIHHSSTPAFQPSPSFQTPQEKRKELLFALMRSSFMALPSNPPLAKNRREVGTLALSLASIVLDVGYGSIDDALLQDLSALIASRRLLQLPDGRSAAHLVLLVNNIRKGFNYTQKLEKLL